MILDSSKVISEKLQVNQVVPYIELNLGLLDMCAQIMAL